MRILLLGATGRVGSAVVRGALQRDIQVRALTRREVEIEGVETRVSDFSKASFSEALLGVDAVVVALGHRWGQRSAFQEGIMRELVAALGARPEIPCAMLTGYGVTLPGERYPVIDQILTWVVSKIRPTMVADGQAASQVLMESDLAWTLLRAPLILRFPRVGYRLTEIGKHKLWTTCEDAAKALLDCIHQPEFRRRAPILSRT